MGGEWCQEFVNDQRIWKKSIQVPQEITRNIIGFQLQVKPEEEDHSHTIRTACRTKWREIYVWTQYGAGISAALYLNGVSDACPATPPTTSWNARSRQVRFVTILKWTWA
jgi:hypothetical protein